MKILPSDSKKWYLDNGDNTLRVNYPELNIESIVVDIGARHGSWSDQIRSKYFSKIFCFEVVPEFCNELKNKGYTVFQKAVFNKKGQIQIGINEGEGSIFHQEDSFLIESIKASEIFSHIESESIDLMKLNVEGAEYSILQDLINSESIKKIKNIQVQFHLIEKHESEYDKIFESLKKTHQITWRYPFVWENWKIL